MRKERTIVERGRGCLNGSGLSGWGGQREVPPGDEKGEDTLVVIG